MVKLFFLFFILFTSAANAEEIPQLPTSRPSQELQAPRSSEDYYKEVLSWKEKEEDYTIDVPAFLESIKDKNTYILDVRGCCGDIKKCCEDVMIENSIRIPSGDITEKTMQERFPDKNSKIIVLCDWNDPKFEEKMKMLRIVYPLNGHIRNTIKALGYNNVYKLENYNVSKQKGTANLLPYVNNYIN